MNFLRHPCLDSMVNLDHVTDMEVVEFNIVIHLVDGRTLTWNCGDVPSACDTLEQIANGCRALLVT